MLWRKWLIRSVVFTIIGAGVFAALVYQRWTDPAVVREQVIAKLQEMYPGAIVTVVSARLRILGGIIVNDLRMCRRDDPEKSEFFYVPSAILYHDKEKLLDGKITLRKVELTRPHMRIIRGQDGKWNVRDIMSARPPNIFLPTVVAHHGTIVIEDRMSGYAVQPLEIGDIQVSFINDPITAVSIDGSAQSAMVGSLKVQGQYRRDIKSFDLKVKTTGTPLSTATLQRIPILCCNPRLAEIKVEATVDVDGRMSYRPGEPQPFDHNVKVRIARGKLRHPALPLPLEDIFAKLECDGGTLRLSDFRARSQDTLYRGRASAQLPKPDQSFEADLEIAHVKVDHELIEKLPEKIQNLLQMYQATGMATVRTTCAKRDGQWVNVTSGVPSRITILPEDARACFTKFAYPIEKLTGSIDWLPQTKRTDIDLTAYAHGRPIQIHGSWQGEGANVNAQIDLNATDVPLDDTLISALPVKFQRLTNSFHPTGKLALKAHLRRTADSPLFHNEFHIYLRDGTVRWDEFPYPLEKVSGLLDIYPYRWEFHEGHGFHHGGEVFVQGQSITGDPAKSYTEDEGLTLRISGKELAMDEDLHKALTPMPQMAKVWENFRPRGRLNFTSTIERRPHQPQDMDILVDVRGCSIEPHFFPYALNDLSGQFRLRKSRLEARNVRARHDDTTLAMDLGIVDLRPGGGYYTDLTDLQVSKLRADEPFVKALPKPLRSFVGSLKMTVPIDIKTRLIIAQSGEPGSLPDIGWDGKAFLKKGKLGMGIAWENVDGEFACSGRHNGLHMQQLAGNFLLDQASAFNQPFKNVHGKFHVSEKSPEDFLLEIHAPIFGGDVTGQVRVEMTSAMRYEMNMTASQINLKDFGKHNLGGRSQINGLMYGRLYLTGLGNNFETLDGHGSIDVPNGHLYNLPLLLDLLKFLGLRWPDRTAFEELHALFSIHGMRVNASKLELIGNVVSLTGKGDFKLDGSDLNLNFYPSWARAEQWLPASIRPISPAISKNFLIIEMRGKVDSNPDHLKFNKRILPILIDPFTQNRERMTGTDANKQEQPTRMP